MPNTKDILENYQETVLKEVFGHFKWWHNRPEIITPWKCPKCYSNQGFRRRGSRPKKVYSESGETHDIKLYQVTCLQCDSTFSPFITMLRLDKAGKIAPDMIERARAAGRKTVSRF